MSAKPLFSGGPKREMKVLSVGLPRTGSASICEALSMLGYENVYHGIKVIDSNPDWKVFNRAADASYPFLPGYTGKPFTREEWDEIYGCCEATTDVAAPFAKELIEAYPDAKVLLVNRDFDRWFKSIDEGVLQTLWGIPGSFAINCIEPLLGSESGMASRKMMLGLFGAKTVDEAREKAREAYDRHHRIVRKMVPPGQLLEYRMGDGWEPLCEFLGKEVPKEDFPWVNEAAALKKVAFDKMKRNAKAAAQRMLPWIGGLAVAGAAAYVAGQKGYLGTSV